jgi:CheY-like chemotaxis protein
MTEYYSNQPIHSKIYREPLRVSDVAKICRVSNKSIVNWINQGALKSFTTQGGHNRVWPSDLQAFIVRAEIDVEFKFDDRRETRFLIVDDKLFHRKLLQASFCDRFPSASVVATQSEYEALLLVGELKPHVVTWDLSMPLLDGVRIIEFLKGCRMNASIQVTLWHHAKDEELKWCAYAGVTQKIGTGLNELLNSLQMLLSTPGIVRRYETSRPALNYERLPIINKINALELV